VAGTRGVAGRGGDRRGGVALRRHRSCSAAPNGRRSTTDTSIAVLPFVDLSEKHDQGYFADGLAEEIVDLKIPVSGGVAPAAGAGHAFPEERSSACGLRGDQRYSALVRKMNLPESPSGARVAESAACLSGSLSPKKWARSQKPSHPVCKTPLAYSGDWHVSPGSAASRAARAPSAALACAVSIPTIGTSRATAKMNLSESLRNITAAESPACPANRRRGGRSLRALNL
jgi:hypothetical protein